MTKYKSLRVLNGPSDETAFHAELKKFLLESEQGGRSAPQAYGDSKGIPTIGIGFNLRDHLPKILAAMSVDPANSALTEDQKDREKYYAKEIRRVIDSAWSSGKNPGRVAELNQLMSQRANDPLLDTLGTRQNSFNMTESEISTAYLLIYEDIADKVVSRLGSLPATSSEKIAIMSLAWNSPKLIGNDFGAALNKSRAEAWYEIRYRNNKDKDGGVAARRYTEAAYFNLYDAGPVTKYQGGEIYEMFNSHKSDILKYENALPAATQAAKYGYLVKANGIDASLKRAHDFLVQSYAVGVDVGIRNIYASHSAQFSVEKPEAGAALLLGMADNQRITALAGRQNVLVTISAGAIFSTGTSTSKTYMVNDGSGGAQFHIRSGAALAIGKSGSVDKFWVDTRNTTRASILSGGKGQDDFNITADATGGQKIKIHFIFTDGSTTALESIYEGLLSGKGTHDVVIINPDASDRLYVNGVEWTGPEWTKLKTRLRNVEGAENDLRYLGQQKTEHYALKSGNIWFSTNPLGDDGAAFDPTAGKLATRLGDLSVEFEGFVNGMLGINVANGLSWTGDEDRFYINGQTSNEHDQGDLIASNDFFSYRGDYLSPGAVSAAAAAISARLLSVDDAENPLVGDAGANTLDPGGTHDYVVGGGGGDTILYKLGYGAVAIEEADAALAPANKLVLGADISPDQVLVTGDADGNLVLALGGSDVITLVSALRSGGGVTYGIQQVQFADGTLWSYSDLLALALDPAVANEGIFGDRQANILDTGGLAEVAHGGGGGDTFVYAGSYGSLVIDESDAALTPSNSLALGTGILPGDVTVTGDEEGNIWLIFEDGGQVQIKGGLLSEAGLSRGVQSVTFTNGISWSYADLLAEVATASLDNPDIFGDRAANVLDGGGLARTATGNGGGDTFVFGLGYGRLAIDETDRASTPSNTLAFGAGINPDDVKVMGAGDGDLLLWVNDDDQVLLANALRSGPGEHYGVQAVTFANGTTWTYADLLARASTASAGRDSIYGDTGANLLDTAGLAQYASGGGGGDTFVYGLGYGDVIIAEHDETASPTNRLSFGAGIDPGDVSIAGDADGGFLLTIAGGGSVTLLGALNDRADGVQQVLFQDGTIWNYSDLLAGALSVVSGETLYGDAGANIFDPLGSADTVIGRGGGDTIHYGLGYGDLRIEEHEFLASGDVNRLSFGAGIGPGDVDVQGNAEGDLLLIVASGTVTLTGALRSDGANSFGVGEVLFADGSIWTQADLIARAAQARTGYTTVYGDASSNLLDTQNAAVIVGGGGGDIFVYNRGYGTVAIDEREAGLAENLLAFGDGITAASVTVSQGGNDILLTLTGTDQVRLIDAADPAAGATGVQTISFASGERWSIDRLLGFLAGSIEYSSGGGDFVLDAATFPSGLVPDVGIDASIDPDTVTVDVRKEDQALILNLPGGDTIVLRHVLGNAAASAQQIVFGDGTTWTFADLLARSRIAQPGHDYLQGTSAAETFDGGGFAQEIVGGGGGDTFVYNPGYGTLIIDERDNGSAPTNQLLFGSGINPNQTYVDSNGEGDIILWVSQFDSVVLKGGMLGGAGDVRGVQEISFSDGTVWTEADLRARLLAAEAGDPGIYGGRGADILDGQGLVGAAYGGGGGDRFVYESGYGYLEIHEMDAAALPDNALAFGPGITFMDLSFSQDGEDAIITLNDGGFIRIIGQYRDDGTTSHFGLQRLIFDDDTEIRFNTTLFGTSGADALDPLGRADLIIGSGGGDTIHYELGYGDILIREEDAAGLPSNTLVLGEGIDPADVSVIGDTDGSIYLEIGSGGEIGLEGALLSRDGFTYGVQTIAFADGTTWSYADLLAKVSVPNPDSGGIYGDTQANLLDPLGQATLVSGNGGGDTIAYNLGYGDLEIAETDFSSTPHNILSLGSGIAAADISVHANESGEIELHLGLDGSTIRLRGALESRAGAAQGVQEVHFADGTVWTYADLLTRVLVPLAGQALHGDTGANVLDGGGVATTIIGRGGGDTIVYNLGYGDMVIDEYDAAGTGLANTLNLGAGIDPGDVTLTAVPWTGALTLGLGDGSLLHLTNMSSPEAGGIETLTFADGTIWNREELWQRALVGRTDNGSLYGRASADIIDPNGHASYVNGGGGGDLIHYVLGYGNLTIDEYNFEPGPDNVLAFAAGIAANEVYVTLDAWSGALLLTMADNAQISISNFQNDPASGVQQIRFADGTVWDREAILSQTRRGSPGNTELFGSGAPEEFDPNGFANLVHTGGGGDTIHFAEGYGEVTIDAYEERDVLNKLVLGAGFTAAGAEVYSDGSTIVIDFGGGDIVRLQGAMGSEDGHLYGVQQVRFADGTIWSDAELRSRALVPTPGQSQIYGSGMGETIDGLGIVNYINAGGGGDRIRYELGYGVLAIDEVNNTDTPNTLVFGGGIDPLDLTASIENYVDLRLSLGNGDELLLRGFLNSVPGITYGFDKVEFANGTIWSRDDLRALLSPNPTDALIGDGAANLFDTHGVQHHIIGGGGADTILYNTGYGALLVEQETGYVLPGKANTIRFGAGIDPANVIVRGIVTFDMDNEHLQLDLGGGDVITLKGAFTAPYTGQVEFADGTIWSIDDLVDRSRQVTSGNDSVIGTESDDVYDGGAGDDFIDGRNGNDILVGGAGNDWLCGSGGDDVYRFELGDGQDRIQDHVDYNSGIGGYDVIELGAGIAPGDVQVFHSGTDLFFRIGAGGDTIRIVEGNGYSDGGYIEEVRFVDGTRWYYSDILDKANNPMPATGPLIGTELGDTLPGNAGNDEIRGLAGNDRLDGREGNDLLIGGAGNDMLIGGNGDDVYRFSLGEGQDAIRDQDSWPWGTGGFDTLEFGTGIDPADLVVTRDFGGDGLRLSINGSSDRVDLENTLVDAALAIEQVRFADGTIWTLDELVKRSAPSDSSLILVDGTAGDDGLDGTSDNDLLSGFSGGDSLDGGWGDDVLIGGTGNDVLTGSFGSDVYRFALGDGQDIIRENLSNNYFGYDAIEFSAGIDPADVVVTQENGGNDLLLSISGTSDTITVEGAITDPARRVEAVRFSDGTVWSHADLISLSIGGMASSMEQSSSAPQVAQESQGGEFLGSDSGRPGFAYVRAQWRAEILKDAHRLAEAGAGFSRYAATFEPDSDATWQRAWEDDRMAGPIAKSPFGDQTY